MCQHPPEPLFGVDPALPADRTSDAAGARRPFAAPAILPSSGPVPMSPMSPASLVSPPPSPPSPPSLEAPAEPGSRRRRLWDLDRHAHCALLGVCLPMAALRRLVGRVSGQISTADDHDLHSSVVGECRSRTLLSEALQKHLDQRYALAVQRAGRIGSTEALAAWWAEASAGRDLPAVFWAVLTHPRCDDRLEHAVLGQVHMLQHQVGMATRAELARFEALIDENAVLGRELASAQQRSLRQASDFAARVAQLEAELVRQRGLTLARDTRLAQLQAQLATLEAAAPQLLDRHRLAQDKRALCAQLQDLQRTLAGLREQLRREQDKAERLQAQLSASQHAPQQAPRGPGAAAAAPLPPGAAAAAPLHPGAAATVNPLPLPPLHQPPEPRRLADQAVLCVGGRQASVPLYRLVIERTGGRFLHHDGGAQDSPHKLDATLAAADLVICQTGCVSHDAYWRVKDHCKRTGKPCMFVDTPSRAALERALAEALAPSAGAPQDSGDAPPQLSTRA